MEKFFTGFFWDLFRKLTALVLCVLSLLGFYDRTETVNSVEVNGSLVAVDALGRSVKSAGESEKKVGMFYFLWSIEDFAKVYNITEIVKNNPDAIQSEQAWQDAGGGGRYEFHHWNEPMFGYYSARDAWVLNKHLQMLTDAGVDFLVFDATNKYTYDDYAKALIEVWYRYLLAGVKVPKLAYYTNTESGNTMNALYDNIYQNAEMLAKYPRLDELWFEWDGKPMVVGDADDTALRSQVKSYFRIKGNQWPTAEKKADGFPWMEFSRISTFAAKYGKDGQGSIMSVSTAQHNDSIRFSGTEWYGHNDRTRSFHNGKNDPDPNAMLYGCNAAEQWDFAIKLDPDMVFVTGFNEWIAQRLDPVENEPIVFCDSCSDNTSRDLEPSAGILGDNYYMQLVDCIRRFKSTSAALKPVGNATIDINGAFAQWDNAAALRYEDYTGDAVNRDSKGFGGTYYTDSSARNDIQSMKIAEDAHYLYFYADTVSALTPSGSANWMNLYLSVNPKANANWNGYDFLLNGSAPAGSKTTVAKFDGTGFAQSADADIRIEGNQLMLRVAKADLGINGNDSFAFKWADNIAVDYSSTDITPFYTQGDAAPLGRLNYQK